jgi:hypothetical protein
MTRDGHGVRDKIPIQVNNNSEGWDCPINKTIFAISVMAWSALEELVKKKN